MSPQPEPVFYSNRAACYVSVEPPQHEKVVADCDEALKLDSRYVKALNRRATALEALERYEDALRGACDRANGDTINTSRSTIYCIRLYGRYDFEQVPERLCGALR